MAMSQAAIDGISVNGMRWKHTVNLGSWPRILGRINDLENDAGDDPEIERAALGIVEAVRNVVKGNKALADTDLLRCADNLELSASCGLDDVNEAMGDLYDSFDYWRILVKNDPAPTI